MTEEKPEEMWGFPLNNPFKKQKPELIIGSWQELHDKLKKAKRDNASLQGKLDDVVSRFDCARGETIAATNRIKELKSKLDEAEEKEKKSAELVKSIMGANEAGARRLIEAGEKQGRRVGELEGLKKGETRRIELENALLNMLSFKGETAHFMAIKDACAIVGHPRSDNNNGKLCVCGIKRIAELEGGKK